MQPLESLKTLVLNADYRPLSYFPLSVLPVEEAVKRVIHDRFDVVAEYDRVIRSPTVTMNVPSVIAVREFVPVKKFAAFNRANIYLRDQYVCQFCSKRFPAHQLTFDHVVPRSKGGRSSWTNVVTACEDCNFRKADKDLSASGLKLIRKPAVPSWSELYEAGRKMPNGDPHPSWSDYLYWVVELDQS